MIDEAIDAHVANEARLLEGLTAAPRGALDAVLRKLLTAVEEAPRGSPPPRPCASSRGDPGDRPLLEQLLGDPAMMRHLGGPESAEKIAERQARYERAGSDQFRIVDVATGGGRLGRLLGAGLVRRAGL